MVGIMSDTPVTSYSKNDSAMYPEVQEEGTLHNDKSLAADAANKPFQAKAATAQGGKGAGALSMRVNRVSLQDADADTDRASASTAAPKGLLARRRMTLLAAQNPDEGGYTGLARSSSVAFLHSSTVGTAQPSTAWSAAGSTSMVAPRKKQNDKLRDRAKMESSDGGSGRKDGDDSGSGREETSGHGKPGGKSFAMKNKALASKRFDRNSVAGVAVSHVPIPTNDAPKWRQWAFTALNHTNYYIFLFVTTLYIVFSDDIKRAALPVSYDLPLEIIVTFVLACILVEMVLSSFIKPGYIMGFHFWIDIIVCASLFFEVPSIKERLFRSGEGPLNLGNQDALITWVGDRAFITGKVARVARIFRLLRLLRLYSLYKRFEAKRRIRAALEKAGIRSVDGNDPIAEEELSLIELEILQDHDRETRVGQKLQELLVRRIIVFTMVCVLVLPAIEPRYGLWGRWQGVDRGGLRMLHDMALVNNTTEQDSHFRTALQTFESVVEYNLGAHHTSLLMQLLIKNHTYIPYPVGVSRRYDEVYFMDYSTWECKETDGNTTLGSTLYDEVLPADVDAANCVLWMTEALFDWKWYSQVAALLSIGRSLFVILFLTLGSWLLTRDSRMLVLEPIERMLARVTALAENPLALQPTGTSPFQEQIEKMALAQEQAAAAARNVAAPSRAASITHTTDSTRRNQMDGLRKAFSTAMGALAGRPAGQNDDNNDEGHAVIAVEDGITADGVQEFIKTAADDDLSGGPPAASAKSKSMSNSISKRPMSRQDAGRLSLHQQQAAQSVLDLWMHKPNDGMARNESLPRLNLNIRGENRTARQAWLMTVHSITTTMHRQMSKVAAAWNMVTAPVRKVLNRIAMNFWDGVYEEHKGGDHSQKLSQASYETQLLENSIQKIGALLAVGFGDAGAEVIAENIRKEGDINPMVPGHKMVAIFGFCDIRRFTDATEVLQEEVMEFVNSIARIVHTSVAIHGGAANKNIGDAFLLVWKLPKGFTMKDLNDACDHGSHKSLLQLTAPYMGDFSMSGDEDRSAGPSPIPDNASSSDEDEDTWFDGAPGNASRSRQQQRTDETHTLVQVLPGALQPAAEPAALLMPALPSSLQPAAPASAATAGDVTPTAVCRPAAAASCASTVGIGTLAGSTSLSGWSPNVEQVTANGNPAAAAPGNSNVRLILPILRSSSGSIVRISHLSPEVPAQDRHTGGLLTGAGDKHDSPRTTPRMIVGPGQSPECSRNVRQPGPIGEGTEAITYKDTDINRTRNVHATCMASDLVDENPVLFRQPPPRSMQHTTHCARVRQHGPIWPTYPSRHVAADCDGSTSQPGPVAEGLDTYMQPLKQPSSAAPHGRHSNDTVSGGAGRPAAEGAIGSPTSSAHSSAHHAARTQHAPAAPSTWSGAQASAPSHQRGTEFNNHDSTSNGRGTALNQQRVTLPSENDRISNESVESLSSPFPEGDDASRSELVVLPSLPSVSRSPHASLISQLLAPSSTQSAAGGSSGVFASMSPHTATKSRFISIPDNRVVPLMSDPARMVRMGTAAAVGGGLDGGAQDIEAEAVRRVMRMRTRNATSHGGGADNISVPEKAEVVAAFADNALASFIIIQAALKRSVRLARYSRRADLAARLGPDFRVQMGFGLHVGWAIEGAIGSEYKIDASYLSPNVNMASRLEAATKQFGVSILMSDSFARCLSVEVKARVRQIDCVTVKGSVQPMGLFTYDVCLDVIDEPDVDTPGAEEEEELFWANYACGMAETNDLQSTWGASPAFLEAFKKGFEAYRQGDWSAARDLLTQAKQMRTNGRGQPVPDPPSQVLLKYMAGFDYKAPPDWRGYRELTEK